MLFCTINKHKITWLLSDTEYAKEFAEVINVNVLVQQIEWDLIGTAAEARCVWFVLDLQTMSSWAFSSSFHCQPPQPLLSILLSELQVLKC